MSDSMLALTIIVGFLFAVLLLALTASLIECAMHYGYGKGLLVKWLSPKTVLAALAVAFICWNVHKMRCAYESKCKDVVKVYSTLISKE